MGVFTVNDSNNIRYGTDENPYGVYFKGGKNEALLQTEKVVKTTESQVEDNITTPRLGTDMKGASNYSSTQGRPSKKLTYLYKSPTEKRLNLEDLNDDSDNKL
jgi:hypothetical protein